MIVGTIGNAQLQGPGQQAWLRNTIKSWLARWDVQLGYTNLESQVGLVFGGILLAAAIPFRVILPASSLPADQAYGDLLDQAVAVHQLEQDDQHEPWIASRMQVMEYCDVVFAILTGEPELDRPILEAQRLACQAQRAVISLDLSQQSATVICKHDQW